MNPAHYCGKAFISSYCQEIFVAVVSNFNTVITFLFDKKYSQRSRNSLPILHFCFRHLLGCVKQLFLLSNYYTGGVLQIPSDGDDPWKLKSTPKKNEYFEYLNKVSAKKRFVSKKSQNGKFQIKKKKTYFDHSRDFEKLARVPPPHPSQVKIVSSPNVPTDNLDSQGIILPSYVKNLKNNAYSLRPTDSTL